MEEAVPRASVPHSMAEQLLRLRAAPLRVEDLEYLLRDVLETLSRLESKRGRLQEQIAAASHGRRAHRRPPAAVVVRFPADGDEGVNALVAPTMYTRKGAGAVRRRLRAAAGGVKKERERLEAVWGELEEALVDAKERLALPHGIA